MSLLAFNTIPRGVAFLGPAIHLAVGIALGVLYFRALWWNVRRFGGDGRVTTNVALMIGRFVLLGGLLTLASLEGALPLLMTALGVLVGRAIVMRHTRQAAP